MEKIADKFNIMVIGDEKVGKTTILERYFNRKFNAERKKTIGVEYYNKEYTDQKTNLTYSLKFWDTAGQEKFRSVTKNYYQRAHGMIIVMSIDYRTSFDNLKMWANSVFENSGNSQMPLVVVCNKIDLEDEREVKNTEVEELCNDDSLKLKVYFTSAKNGTNIDNCFSYIIESVIKANSETKREGGSTLRDSVSTDGSKSKCC